jgi:hypothetical protein
MNDRDAEMIKPTASSYEIADPRELDMAGPSP